MQTIATGTTAADCVPINPQTGTPYFTICKEGWGTGWTADSAMPLTETPRNRCPGPDARQGGLARPQLMRRGLPGA